MMNFNFLKGMVIKPAAILLIFSCILIACAKENKKNDLVPPEIKASAIINGQFTSLTNTDVKIIFEDGQVINRITLTRLGGIRIVLQLPGTAKGSFELLPGVNMIPGASLTDQFNRVYQCVEGRASISNYYTRDGFYELSGTFEFLGEFQVSDTTSFEVSVKEGGFVNVNNTSDI